MSTPNDIKKNITKNWLVSFPKLSSYSQNKLYKVIGPFVAGIELIKVPFSDDYRPTYSSYPLWKSNEKECMLEPMFLQELINKRGFQFNIPYLKNESFFQEAVECARKQLLISLENDVYLSDLFKLIDNQFSQTLVKASPVGQAKLYEFKLFAALYVGEADLVNKILFKINQTAKNWEPSLFEWKFGKVDNWLKGLHEKISNRENFLNQIELNKQERKISKLINSELFMG
jgi:hypothetical protein